MRKISSWIVTLAVVLSLVIPSFKVDAADVVFTDIPDNYWAAEEIYQFVDQGVIQGYEDGTFGINDNITRGQAAVMLARLLDVDLPNSDEVTKYFDDVKATANSASAIVAINNAGIMEGANGKFRPYNKLTREQMASIIVRALDLEQGDNNVDIYLGNVSEVHRNSVQTIANLKITDQLDNYNPAGNITRVQFVAMLSRAIQGEDEQSISELLKEVYANEQQLQSYEMGANINLGVTLPQLAEELPEAGLIAEMLEDIKINVTGAYQKDPMLIEANVDMTMKLNPQVDTTISIPVIMSENKIWMKMPQIPGEELPEELVNKFIEIDMDELGNLQDIPTVDMDAQLKFAEAIQNLFIDYFAEDYYSKVELGSYDVPANINAKHVVKFNLTNEDLEPFVTTLMTGFLPDFIDLMSNPEYAAAMGLTAEEINEVQEELQEITANIDEIVSLVNDMLHINKFEEYIVINEDNIIVNDVLNLDFNVTVEGETAGAVLSVNQSKWNINGDVTINIPKKEDTISFEELLEQLLEDMDIPIV